MRHSDIHLTMMTYTDPKLLDVQGALDSLPSLPLSDSPMPKREAARATGTHHARSSLGQGLGKIGTSEAIPSYSRTHSPTPTAVAGSTHSDAENITIPSEKALPAGFASKASQVGMTGFEPATSTSRTQPHRVATEQSKEVPATLAIRDTSGDTNSPENERGEVVGGLVSSRVDSLPIKADSFASALAMIASLPLSDAEKADAVRRLMAERTKGVAGDGG